MNFLLDSMNFNTTNGNNFSLFKENINFCNALNNQRAKFKVERKEKEKEKVKMSKVWKRIIYQFGIVGLSWIVLVNF